MKAKFWIGLLIGVMGIVSQAKADLAIDVSGAQRDPMPIALADMIHDCFFLGQQGN